MNTVLKYEGHPYTITAFDEPKTGLFVFVRAGGAPKQNGTYRQGVGVMADLREAEEGFVFLPGRCAPLLLPRVQQAEKEGVFARAGVAPKAFMDAIMGHPKYQQGRDDLAEALISQAYGIALSQTLPEGFIPPSIVD